MQGPWTGSYCGPAALPGDWFARWNLDPLLLLLLGAGAMIATRSANRSAALGAVAVLAVAFVSPLCSLSVALFSARAAHHLLIVAVAAPLLALATPAARASGVALPLAGSTAILWFWHLPTAYDAALADKVFYWVMQAMLIASATWFWRAALAASASPVERLAGVIGGAVQMGFLGAILTFAPRPLYDSHLTSTLPFGIGPLADQQLAGLVMWVPGMIPYAIAAALVVRGGWLRMRAA